MGGIYIYIIISKLMISHEIASPAGLCTRRAVLRCCDRVGGIRDEGVSGDEWARVVATARSHGILFSLSFFSDVFVCHRRTHAATHTRKSWTNRKRVSVEYRRRQRPFSFVNRIKKGKLGDDGALAYI
jgi:hypothetical protein